MKKLFSSLFIFVSLSSVAQAADVPADFYPNGTSCVQVSTNDGFLPQNLTFYQSKNGFDRLFIKFYIGNDLRHVVAQQTSRTINEIQYKNVRLFDEDKGHIVGGHMGITFNLDINTLSTGGDLYWIYFDGGKAQYRCSIY